MSGTWNGGMASGNLSFGCCEILFGVQGKEL